MKGFIQMSDCNIIIASDPEHDKVFAEIQFDNRFVALVSQEDGPGQLKVELPGLGLDEACVLRIVPLGEFVTALEKAAEKLIAPP